MNGAKFKIRARVWLYKGDNPWHFATIEKDDADEIKKFESGPRRGFGSVKVSATIGKTTWQTSIFPEKIGTFVLPIKKAVRSSENIKAGSEVNLIIELLK